MRLLHERKNGTRNIEGAWITPEADIRKSELDQRRQIVHNSRRARPGQFQEDRPALKLTGLSCPPPYAGRRVAVYSEWNLTSAGRGVAECGQQLHSGPVMGAALESLTLAT